MLQLYDKKITINKTPTETYLQMFLIRYWNRQLTYQLSNFSGTDFSCVFQVGLISFISIYLNWKSFSPNAWKRSTLWTLIKRAYSVCSSEKHLVVELKQLEYVFEKCNNFPHWFIDQLLSEVQSEDVNIRSSIQENQNDVNKTAHLLVLTYAGLKGEKLIKSMKNV